MISPTIRYKGATGSDLSLIIDNEIVNDRGNCFKVVAEVRPIWLVMAYN